MLTLFLNLVLAALLLTSNGGKTYDGRVIVAGDVALGKQVVCAATNRPPKFECGYQYVGKEPFRFWQAVKLHYTPNGRFSYIGRK